MVILYPTKFYIERIISLLKGDSISISLDWIRVGFEAAFWDSQDQLPLEPNIFHSGIQTIYNEGTVPPESYYPISAKFESNNKRGTPVSGDITFGLLFPFRFKGVLSALPPYWSPDIDRLIIEIPAGTQTVNINAIEFDVVEGTEKIPLFYVSTPLIPISSGTIADWDCELFHVVSGAKEVE